VVFFAAAVPNLPCALPGGDSCPPPDDAEELVPAGALLYAHANLDPDTEQYEHVAGVAAAIPVFTQQIAIRALAQVPGPQGGAPAFERDIEPWFGGEAALAIVPAAGQSTDQIALLEIADAKRAARFAAEIAAGRPQSGDYRGVELTVDGSGLATAQVGGFLAIGPPGGVRAAIDTEAGGEGAESLADDSQAADARDELPDHRLAEAYLSAEGVAELIEPARGLLGTLTPLLAPGATEGAAVALAAEDGEELELSVRSVLDSERARNRPGFFAAFPPFEPQLPELLREDALGYVGIAEPPRTIRALLAQASAQAPGIAAGFEDLVASLRRSGEIDIERELLPALGGEAAFALEPGPGAAAQPARPPLPYLKLVADDVDEERARRALASLQAPVAAAIDPQIQAPVFGERELGGVETRTLRISPVIELAYAVFDGLAVVATDPLGIGRLAEGDGGLDEAELFEAATEDLGEGDERSLFGFFDLGELVALGERLGLSEDPVYATFAAEFRRLGALGLAVRSESDLLSTDARLLLGEARGGGGGLEALAPPSD
ncbi:MAG: DUF3352 domain-containing protein, partial [Solirubrobacterales bacterium]